jgi:hypothetical protein
MHSDFSAARSDALTTSANLSFALNWLKIQPYDTLSLRCPERMFLTSETTCFSMVLSLSYPARFTHTFFRGCYEVGLSKDA